LKQSLRTPCNNQVELPHFSDLLWLDVITSRRDRLREFVISPEKNHRLQTRVDTAVYVDYGLAGEDALLPRACAVEAKSAALEALHLPMAVLNLRDAAVRALIDEEQRRLADKAEE